METPAEICENYQLKWSSYTTYIHSCISSSIMTDDYFADVALVTMDGHKIMAHRFVLSYASQYLNKALRFQPKVTTALPLMIVLPQSITYKALKILVKYMYSGEATVPKDILNVVLKAGDILKIKGLYREPLDEEMREKIHKDKPGSTNQVPNPESVQQTKSKDKTPESQAKPQQVATQKQIIVETVKAKGGQKVSPSKLLVARQQNKVQEKQVSGVKQYGGPKVLNFTMTNFNGTVEKENASPKRTIILNQKIAQQSEKPHTITSADAVSLESPNSSDSTTITIKNESSKGDNLQYLVIKDEPIEWTEADMEIVEEKEVFPEESVKMETYDSTSNEGSTNEMYTPLTCELCTETFTIPGEWVKHVQTHTDMLPAKRRRRDSPDDDDENATYPELHCDLCEKSFPTPAEWVRHIQDTHTEFELSLSNRKQHAPKKQVKPINCLKPLFIDKKCLRCNKSFSSSSSMVVHQRTHTGEQPFYCEICKKGFNVKSNLLRHMRTLHNKIIDATEVHSVVKVEYDEDQL